MATRAIQIEDGQTPNIVGIRRPSDDQLAKYAEWARTGMYLLDSGQQTTALPHITLSDMAGRSDGHFPSGPARLWTLTPEREAELIALSAEREAKRKAARAAERAAYKPLPRNMRPCPRCGTYCCGDCTAS